MGIFYGFYKWKLWIGLIIFISCTVFGNLSWNWAEKTGLALFLRTPKDPLMIYADESRYSYIKIVRFNTSSSNYKFIQDTLIHSVIHKGKPLKLQQVYTKIFAAVTHRLSNNKKKLTTLTIGGGGYVVPRYLEAIWQGSCTEVVEISPAVTKAAIAAFELSADTKIKIFHMDGRAFVNRLIHQQNRGIPVKKYDIIYLDAFNDYLIPPELTTIEFSKNISRLLLPDGAYIINAIGTLEQGIFLGAMINTLEKIFPYVHILTEKAPSLEQLSSNYIFVCTMREVGLQNLNKAYISDIPIQHLSQSHLKKLKSRSQGLILTDDYAPVENLLANFVQKAKNIQSAGIFSKYGNYFLQKRKINDAVKYYYKTLQFNPNFYQAHNNLGAIFANKREFNKAIKHFSAAVLINPDLFNTHINLGNIFIQTGRFDEAEKYFFNAIRINPDAIDAHIKLGFIFLKKGYFRKADYHFSKVLRIDPENKMAKQGLRYIEYPRN